jgi:hypothetical protein
VTGTGSPQPDVQMSAINQGTGEMRRTVSGSDGQFALCPLAPNDEAVFCCGVPPKTGKS